MLQRLWFGFAVMTLAVVSAAETHRITLYQPSVVAGKELKAGDYKLEVMDNKVVISQGKQSVEAAVKVENADAKYSSTSVRYTNGDGKYQIQEIRIGNSKTKLIFQQGGQAGL